MGDGHEVSPGIVLIGCRIPADLRESFEAVAVCADRTFSAELRRVMRAHVEAQNDDEPAGNGLASRLPPIQAAEHAP